MIVDSSRIQTLPGGGKPVQHDVYSIGNKRSVGNGYSVSFCRGSDEYRPASVPEWVVPTRPRARNWA